MMALVQQEHLFACDSQDESEESTELCYATNDAYETSEGVYTSDGSDGEVAETALNDLMDSYSSTPKIEALALPLTAPHHYHIFFLNHTSDQEWVYGMMEKLAQPAMGFSMCCLQQTSECRASLTRAVIYGIKHSQRTILVLTTDMLAHMWYGDDAETTPLLTKAEVTTMKGQLFLLILQDCDIPSCLLDLPCVDVNRNDWWSQLLSLLIPLSSGKPALDVVQHGSSSNLMTSDLEVESGELVVSIKSHCQLCGKELVEPRDVPDDFLSHGIQIPPEEYRDAVASLMADRRFTCHVWCYNLPVAVALFTFFLALCLIVIPVLETQVMFHGKQTGLEYVHATVLWLCVLMLYLIILQIAKLKLRSSVHKKLAAVNANLIKFNLLAGIEDLGTVDCNKYLLHFIYYEIGPCLSYLEEVLMRDEPGGPYLPLRLEVDEEREQEQVLVNMEEAPTDKQSHSPQLNSSDFDAPHAQCEVQDVLLKHSGEYISLLISKKLDNPAKCRHISDTLCLCQFVERKLYNIKV